MPRHALIVGRDGGLVRFQPALFLVRPHNRAQAAFDGLGNIDAQTARGVEQLGLDEELTARFLTWRSLIIRQALRSMRKTNAHKASRQAKKRRADGQKGAVLK